MIVVSVEIRLTLQSQLSNSPMLFCPVGSNKGNHGFTPVVAESQLALYRTIMGVRRAPILLLLMAGVGCASAKEPPVRIFAAASTREAIEQIAQSFQDQTGLAVETNFGASSTLARQIERGADANLFLSADSEWAVFLANKGLVDRQRDLLSNRLVVIVPAKSATKIQTLDELAGPEIMRLALAGPQVPAGRYARDALTHAGIWDRLQDRVIEGGDVRQALAYVDREEAEAGIVYATDVIGSSKVRAVLEIDSRLHAPIRYPLVLIRRQQDKPDALRFYDFVASPEAGKVFHNAGFEFLSK
jgi:molybdate transport system substrate-binding protein